MESALIGNKQSFKNLYELVVSNQFISSLMVCSYLALISTSFVISGELVFLK